MNEELKARTRKFALRTICMFTALPKKDVARVLGKQVLRFIPHNSSLILSTASWFSIPQNRLR